MADSVLIRSADGNRRAWLSRGPEPKAHEGELGEHLDTGDKLVYFQGKWRRQSLPGEVWVSPYVRVPYGATSGALDANDALGDKIYFRTSIDGRPLPRRGRILTIRRTDPSDVVLADTIHISTHDFTAAASDAAFTIGVEDSRFFVTSQTFPAGTDVGAAKVAVVTDVNEDYFTDEGHLVAQLSTTGTPTPTVGAMPLIQLFILPL